MLLNLLYGKKKNNFIQPLYVIKLMLCMLLIYVCFISYYGVNMSIDLSGGSEIQIKFAHNVSSKNIKSLLKRFQFKDYQVQEYLLHNEKNFVIRVSNTNVLTNHQINKLSSNIIDYFNYFYVKKSLNIYKDKYIKNNIKFYMPIPLQYKNENLFKFIFLQEKALVLILKKNIKCLNDIHIDKYVSDNYIEYNIYFGNMITKLLRIFHIYLNIIEIKKFNIVYSQLSNKLIIDSIIAVLYAIMAVFIYIAIRFGLLFSVGAVCSLFYDIIGAIFIVFVALDFNIDLSSIAAMLTIIGYSINNTIVLYDRIKELYYMNKNTILSYNDVIILFNRAVSQIYMRTIYMTITTCIVCATLSYLVPGYIRSFSLYLCIGILLGSISSLFMAPNIIIILGKYYKNGVLKNYYKKDILCKINNMNNNSII